MKEKTANQLARALEEMLEANKLSATEILEVMLEAPIPAKAKKLVRVGYKAGFMHALRAMPEPKKEQLAKALAMIESFKSFPYKMRSLLKQAVKELPHAPGGPKRKLTPEEENVACAEIEALRGEHGNRQAIHRVALKKGVSARTMYRIWGKHHPQKKEQLRTAPAP